MPSQRLSRESRSARQARPTGFKRARGLTLSTLIGSLALGLAVTVGVLTLPSPTPAFFQPAPLTNHEVAVTLSRLRLNAEPLAAAGVSDKQTTALVGNMRSHLAGGAMAAIRAGDIDIGIANNSVDALTRRIQAGLGTKEDLAALASATQELTAARESLSALLTTAFNEAVANLDKSTVSLISTHRANCGGPANEGVATKYLFTVRTEAQWVGLRDALSNVAINGRYGTTPNPDFVTLINAANAESATVAASANLNANLTAVQAAWTAAVYPQ